MRGFDASRVSLPAPESGSTGAAWATWTAPHVVLNFMTATAVPEPAALAVLGIGLPGLAAIRRRA